MGGKWRCQYLPFIQFGVVLDFLYYYLKRRQHLLPARQWELLESADEVRAAGVAQLVPADYGVEGLPHGICRR